MNQEARNGLWNFISAHFSMVSRVIGNIYTDEPLAFWLEDGDIKETIAPYYMARIVDAKQFIAEYPFRAIGPEMRRLRLSLMIPWWSGTRGYLPFMYRLQVKGS